MMLNNPGIQVEDHDVCKDGRQERGEETTGRTNLQHSPYQILRHPKIVTVQPHRDADGRIDGIFCTTEFQINL